MKKILRIFLRKPWTYRFLAPCIAAYMQLLWRTNRWTKYNWTVLEQYWAYQKPFIACFWHNRLLMQGYFWESSSPFHMLISGHRDGIIIAHTVHRLGIKTIAGSSSKGGAKALREIIDILKKGGSIGITPDGPRGPRFQVSEGIIQIAKLSGMDIVPCAYSTTGRKVWGSWDRFIVALPFGRGAMVVGEPIKPPQTKEEFKKVKDLVQKGLENVCDQADALCGHSALR